MKHAIAIGWLLISTFYVLPVSAQNPQLAPFDAVFFGKAEQPAQWLAFAQKPIQSVVVWGHWKSLDDKNPIAGFNVSIINCSKPNSDTAEGGCTEKTTSVTPGVVVDSMIVTPDYTEYSIISWTNDGLTARTDDNLCHESHTLEIDFHTGSVLVIDAPTKISKNIFCEGPAAEYQLMEGTTFAAAAKKTVATVK